MVLREEGKEFKIGVFWETIELSGRFLKTRVI
jgi:hypothetical protein